MHKMRLKMLEIQGFKSFPDKTKLTFNQDITAVIGPNGSGKSNISDAVRWVLGEQSNKQLRGKSMEDVIFGGTAARKALGFAEVTIFFDNADRGLKFDEDDVSVTRRYYRSGESEYKINGASVRLKDVHELFMDTGLGRDGYSMIGQGRIDEIVGSKSDERRDIFEEAAGISRFRYRKAEAERRLERAEENMLRLRDIAEELESRIGPLKNQSEKAQEFLTLSVEKKDLEIGLWLDTIQKSKDELRDFDYKLTLAKEQYDKIERELTELGVKGELNSRDIQSIAVQIDSFRRRTAENDEQSANTKSEIAVLKNTIEHNNETIERIRRDIVSANDSDDAIDGEIAAKNDEIARLGELCAALSEEIDEKSAALIGLNDDSGDYSKQIEDKTAELNTISASLGEDKIRKYTAENAKEELIARASGYDDEAKSLRDNLARAEKELSAIKDDIAKCDEQITECKNVVGGFEIKLSARTRKLDEKKQECDKAWLDIGETERRIKILDDLERNMEGYSGAVKTVTKEASHGALRGIHGPVSKLIKVPGEYSLAIETALGATAQNIVVENEEDAKRAIAHLKRTDSGRATFLPLTAIKPNLLHESGVEKCIGFVGMADALVGCDKKYDDVVSSLLGRTVIAEDMDSAVAMGKKFSYRFRVVTLDGQVVNAGGSLTGGSHIKNVGLLSRSSQSEKLREKLKQMKKRYDEQSAELKALSEEVAKMNATMQTASSELATANEDKIRLDGEYRLLDEQKNTAAAALDSLDDEKKNSAKKIDEYDKIIAECAANTAKNERRRADIEQDIESLTGGRDKMAERRQALSDSISTLRLELIGYNKDADNLRASITQLEAAKTDRDARIKLLEDEISEIEAKSTAIEEQIKQLDLLNNGFITAATDAKSEIERLSSRREELEREALGDRTAEREKLDDREKISGEIARLGERRDMMENEYNDIIARLYDEYELTLSAAKEIATIPEDVPEATKRLNELRRKIKALGSVNVAAIEEYKEVSERYEFMRAQLDDIEKSRAELTKLINELTGTMREMFTEKFAAIAANFTEVFKQMFGGGTAELRLTDPDNVLETGIDIIAQPPGKKIAIIEQLSGGEKALIAVSIYFAIMKVNPPPFCLLDEVEAALDDINVDRFAKYLRSMSDDTQFIVITHRRGTMEEADVLYGVTMQEKGVSKLLSIDVSQIEKTLESKVAK